MGWNVGWWACGVWVWEGEYVEAINNNCSDWQVGLDKERRTLISRIHPERHVTMTMSNVLPISATYRDVPLQGGKWSCGNYLEWLSFQLYNMLWFGWGIGLIPEREQSEEMSVFLCQLLFVFRLSEHGELGILLGSSSFFRTKLLELMSWDETLGCACLWFGWAERKQKCGFIWSSFCPEYWDTRM